MKTPKQKFLLRLASQANVDHFHVMYTVTARVYTDSSMKFKQVDSLVRPAYMQGHVNNEPYLQVPSGHYNVSWHSIDWHTQCVDNQLSPEVIAMHAVLVHKSHVWADTIFLMTRLKPATFSCESHFLSVGYFHNACQLGLSQQPFKPSLLKNTHTHLRTATCQSKKNQ